MKLITQEPNPSGGYPPIQEVNFAAVPPGTARWPDDIPSDSFFEHSGFVTLDIQEADGVPTVMGYEVNQEAWEAFLASIQEEPEPDVEGLRETKLQEVGAACSAAIYAGIEVSGSHYSLTEHDQMEIMAQYTTVKEGAAAVPYHADGELCRMYPAEEFAALAQAATAHVFLHRTYCNHLNAWIRRAGLEELSSITYDAALPEDLAVSMTAIMAAAGGKADAV